MCDSGCGAGGYWWPYGDVALAIYQGETAKFGAKYLAHGPGVVTFPDGSTFAGNLDQGLPGGQGSSLYAKCDPDSECGMMWAPAHHTGHYRQGVFDGHGTVVYRDGMSITGTFGAGTCQPGAAIVTWPVREGISTMRFVGEIGEADVAGRSLVIGKLSYVHGGSWNGSFATIDGHEWWSGVGVFTDVGGVLSVTGAWSGAGNHTFVVRSGHVASACD